MNFKTLHIGTYSGTPSGSIEFNNELGEIKLKLDDEMVQEILQVCAEALVRVSKQAADEMTAEVLDGLGLALPEPEASPKRECTAYPINGCAHPQLCEDGCKGQPHSLSLKGHSDET